MDALAARRRSISAFAALAVGFAIARATGTDPMPWFAAAIVASIVAALAHGRACKAMLLVAVVAFGAGWFTLRIETQPRDRLILPANDGTQPGLILTVRGVATESPRPNPPARGALARFAVDQPGAGFPIRIDTLVEPGGSTHRTGLLWVRTSPDVLGTIEAGDRVQVIGLAFGVRPPMNPGEPDRRLTAAQTGLVGTIRAPTASLITRIDGPTSALGRARCWWWRARARLRARADSALEDNTTGRGRALLGSLLLGEYDPTMSAARGAFARLGLAHLLAISGFHLAVMAGVGLMLVRLTGDRGWLEPAIVAVLVLGYLLIVPARAPVVRAGVMALVLLASEASGRRYDRLTLLAWIAAGILLARPMDLYSAGFQLSFGITGALLWLMKPVRGRLFGEPIRGLLPSRKDRLLRPIRELATASLIAWAVAGPLVAYRFGLVSPLAVVTTVVVLPMIVVVLWLGYATLLAAVLAPSLAAVAGRVLDVLGDATMWIVSWLDAAPGTSFHVPRVSLWLTAGATGLVLYWFVRGHRRDGGAWAATVLVIAWYAVEIGPATVLQAPVALRVDTLAVGDGACHLLRSDNEAMLWDCGSTNPAIGVRTIPRAVRALGAGRVDRVILSHANFDHFCGLLDVIGPLGVRRVYVGKDFLDDARTHPAAAALLEELDRRGVTVEVVGVGDRIELGHATLTILSPPRGARFESANNHSLVGLVGVETEAGPRRVMMTGDIEQGAMRGLIDRGVRADVLEIPHHGSSHDTAYELLVSVGPRIVLQSTGPKRAGDPRWAQLRRDLVWYTTATDGAAWVELRRDGSVRSGSIREKKGR